MKERKKQKIPAYIDMEEFNNLIHLVRKPHHKLAFILAFHSGLRISEVVKLKIHDVDLKNRKILIKDSKYGRDRVVPLPKGFRQKQLDYIPMIPKFFKNEASGIRSLQISFKNYLRKSDLKKEGLHFHSLRHSFAVRLMERGIPLNQIQILLGHSNISTTSVYLKINPQDALKSYEELW